MEILMLHYASGSIPRHVILVVASVRALLRLGDGYAIKQVVCLNLASNILSGILFVDLKDGIVERDVAKLPVIIRCQVLELLCFFIKELVLEPEIQKNV